MSMHPNPILRCIRSFLVSACVLFMLVGGVILFLGIGVYVALEDSSHFLNTCYISPATFVIIAGILIISIFFCGCYGVCYQSVYSILMFAACLASIVILELLGIYAYPSKVKYLCDAFVSDVVDRYKTDDEIYRNLKSFLEPRAQILTSGVIIIELMGLLFTCVLYADARKHTRTKRKKRESQLKEEVSSGYKPVEKIDAIGAAPLPEKK